MVPYNMTIEVNKKDPILNPVTVTDPIMERFKITKYYNKRTITIANLVEATDKVPLANENHI